jgi:hypothetical protein
MTLENLRILSPGVWSPADAEPLVEAVTAAVPPPPKTHAELMALQLVPYHHSLIRIASRVYWDPSGQRLVRSIGPDDPAPADVEAWTIRESTSGRPSIPSDADAKLLKYVPWHVGLEWIKKLPGSSGESVFLNPATNEHVRSREYAISEHPAMAQTTTRRMQEHNALVERTIDIFERLIWPRYSSDAVEIRLQENLHQIGAHVYWDGSKWVIVARLLGDPRSDLGLLLHEAIHARDHAPKLDHRPDWITPTGAVSESRLLAGIRRRERDGRYGYMQDREDDAEEIAEAELERLWPSR